MIFKHEDMILDLTESSKAKLYKSNTLLFLGDGYKAILSMINNSEDKQPVKEKFHAQLSMREKPRFTQQKDNLEALKREALAALEPKTKKKRR